MLEIATESPKPGVRIIRLAGKLMMGPESAALESLVQERVEAGDRMLVFDLAGLKQIDSTGIGRFISAFNRLLAVGGNLAMCGAQPVVRQSFRVTRLDTVFRFYDAVDDALRAG
jgi:anti-sigma B factor antagonist